MGPKNGDDFARERYEARAAAREGRQAQRDAAGAEARAKRAEAEASAVAEMAKVREATMLRFIEAGVTDAVVLTKGTNIYANRYAKPRAPGEVWDPVFEFKRALHESTGKGLRPLNPRGEPAQTLDPPNASAGQPRQVMTAPGLPRAPVTSNPYARSRADHEREREAYRARLRELGLLDPAFGSIPGGGGPLGGG